MSQVRRKLATKCTFGAAAILVAAGAAGGCSQQVGDESVKEVTEELSSSANKILGFESTANWAVTSGTGIVLRSSTTHSQGANSLSLNAHGVTAVRSAAIGVSSALPADIAVDVQIPSHASSGWTGSMQLFGECASKGLAKTSFGTKTLVGLPTGKFNTLGFKIPSTSLTKLASGCSDLRLTVSLSVPTNSVGSYLLDNVELGGVPVQISCSPMGEGGYAFYQAQVTRPDLGVLTLSYSSYSFGYNADLKYVELNGSALYEDYFVVDPTRVTNRWLTTYAPVLPEHQTLVSTDGNTMTIAVDDKVTPSVPVGTDPKTIRFTDGTALPSLSMDANIQDALQALEKDAAAHAVACFSSNAPSDLLAVGGDPHQGNGGVSGLACNGCDWGCRGKAIGCSAAAAVASAGCGLFYPVCIAAAGAVCIGNFESCESDCHKSGTDCCPVGCGGESGILPPIGACCHSGDSCARRATDEHVALCCGPGTTGCGGQLCCTADEQCATRTTGPKQRGIILDAACCGPNNTNSKGECCNLGKCTTSADCGGSNTCQDGCCIIG